MERKDVLSVKADRLNCPDIRRVLNTSRLRSTSLTFMLNGNHKPAVKVNKNKILVFNTCAFDAFLAAITTGYIDCHTLMKI